MNAIKDAYRVSWPGSEPTDNFRFSALHPDGSFTFQFRFFNGRWNGWCELPSGEVRAFGVEPGVVSWAGFLDYGLLFLTNLPEIGRDSLFLTDLLILSWR